MRGALCEEFRCTIVLVIEQRGQAGEAKRFRSQRLRRVAGKGRDGIQFRGISKAAVLKKRENRLARLAKFEVILALRGGRREQR